MDDLLLAPPHLDPETLKHRGSILNIVKSAHKWGGNGTEPDFDKIKRVLMEKHPEVIAKAFGGDPNRAAAWIKDQWYSIFRPGVQWRGKKDTTPGFSLGYDLVPADSMADAELFLADDTAEETSADELVWLPISKTGRWEKSPLPGGKPLVLTRDFFEQMKSSFEQGAWEHVTVPLSHSDRVDENTGFVRALDIRPDPKRDGEFKLWGGIDFRLPDIKEKVLAGAIAGRSIGAATKGITRTSDGRHFPNVLKHVALTNQPWLAGLDDGETLAASYDLVDDPDSLHLSAVSTLEDMIAAAEAYLKAESDPEDVALVEGMLGQLRKLRAKDTGEGEMSLAQMPADVHWREAAEKGDSCGACTHFNGSDFCDLWNASTDAGHVSDGFEATADTTARDLAAAKPAAPQAARPVIRIARPRRGGESRMGDKENDVLEMSREEFDAHVADQVQLAVEERDRERNMEMDKIRRENRDLTVDRKVAQAQKAGHAPALIGVAKEIWLADVREAEMLTLAREEGEVKLSATKIVDDLLAAIPASALAATDYTPGNGSTKPDQSDPKERADALWDRLHPDV